MHRIGLSALAQPRLTKSGQPYQCGGAARGHVGKVTRGRGIGQRNRTRCSYVVTRSRPTRYAKTTTSDQVGRSQAFFYFVRY